MSRRPVDPLIEDICEAVEKVERYTEGVTRETFDGNDKTKDTVVRSLHIIGEAANRLSDGFKEKHPEVESNKIVGLRHRIVHEYFGVDLEIIWQILQGDFLVFKEALKTIRAD
jgi:uncharacterized protein with HEPN domain